MSEVKSRLGGRLPLLDRNGLSTPQTKLWDEMDASMGKWSSQVGFESKSPDGHFIGPFNPMLRSPTMAEVFLKLQLCEAKSTDLSDRERQVVILSVGSVWRSAYELYAHSAAACHAGFSAAAVEALVAGRPCAELDAKEALAQRLALAITVRRTVDDALYAQALAAFGEKGLVDFIVLAGCYDLVCSLLNLFDIPAPPSAA